MKPHGEDGLIDIPSNHSVEQDGREVERDSASKEHHAIRAHRSQRRGGKTGKWREGSEHGDEGEERAENGGQMRNRPGYVYA
jgi:hypothetical protein